MTDIDQVEPAVSYFTTELRFWGSPKIVDVVEKFKGNVIFEAIELPREAENRFVRTSNGKGFNGFQPEWKTLEDGLEFLTTCFLPHAELVGRLSREHHAAWWCGNFSSGFDSSSVISPVMLKTLSLFEIPIYLQTYGT